MTHAALNGFIPLFLASVAILWMQQFVIICYSKAAKRNKPVVSKKEPISADVIKKSLSRISMLVLQLI